MQLKIHKISLWVVHLSVLINILLLIADFTFPKKEEEIEIIDISTNGRDSNKSRKQSIFEFNDFTIYGNNENLAALKRFPNNKYYVVKNKYIENRTFIKVLNTDSLYTNKIFIGYHCYNSYFVYVIFLAICAYIFLIYNYKDATINKILIYFTLPISLVFIVNIIVQF